MKVYFDENFPPQIAKALQILHSGKNREGIKVLNVSDVYGRGADDDRWIVEVAKKNGFIVTQDLNIHRSRQQKEIYVNSGCGIIFIKPPSKTGYTYWQFVHRIFCRWNDVVAICKKKKPPFALILRPNSMKFDEWGNK